MNTQDSQFEEARFIEQLEAEISEWFNNLGALYDKTYIEYKPIVDEICTINATEDEVDSLLTFLFDFCEDERFMALSKKICRSYYEIYSDLISCYVKEYIDIYEFEDVEISEYDYLFNDKENNDK